MRTSACFPLLLCAALAAPVLPGRADAGTLEPYLARVADAWLAGDEATAEALVQGRGGRLQRRGEEVLIPVVLVPWDGLGADSIDPDLVVSLGGRVDATSRSFVRVLAPPWALPDLALHPDVQRVRAPISLLPQGFGSIESEAVPLTGADTYHAKGYDGAGVKVAVLDAGFHGLTDAIDAGELPKTTQAVAVDTEVAWSGVESVTPHGTAIAENLMDHAPGVQLYCIQIDDEVDVQNAADYVATEGIPVVNLSAAFVPTAYYDDTSVISGIVNASHDDDGVFWAVSAGNYAISHWRGTWGDDGDGLLNFNGFDHENEILTQHTTVAVFLNWDQYDDPETDLDLFVYDASGAVKASSEDLQQSGGPNPPSEYLSFPYDDGEDPYDIVVSYVSGPSFGLDVTVIAFFDAIEHSVAASSVMEPADAHGAFSVGAVDQAQWDDPAPDIEVFSSQGPTVDGRLKPDLVAPDRTSTMTYGPGSGQGTSHAAPIAAGAAALLLGRDPTLDAVDLAGALTGMAADLGDPGPDPVFGAGQLKLELDPCVDADGDGFGTGPFANAGCADPAVDCDDTDPAVFPGAPEVCNGIDDDCDPATDEDADVDGDGATPCDGDCDDNNAAMHPAADEICDDGVDNDCDGDVDALDGDCAGDDDVGDDDGGDDDVNPGDDDTEGDSSGGADEASACACRLGPAAPAAPVALGAVLLLALIHRRRR